MWRLPPLFICFQHIGHRNQDRSAVKVLGDDLGILPFRQRLIGIWLPGEKHKRDATLP